MLERIPNWAWYVGGIAVIITVLYLAGAIDFTATYEYTPPTQ